jgi:hypothetical protein
MTTDQIKQLCPKAENVTITAEGTVGMKVGDFAQATNVDLSKGHEEASRQIKNLYLDLQAMNRETDAQLKAANG